MIFSTADRAKKKTHVILALIVFHGFMVIGIVLAVKGRTFPGSGEGGGGQTASSSTTVGTMINIGSTSATVTTTLAGQVSNNNNNNNCLLYTSPSPRD